MSHRTLQEWVRWWDAGLGRRIALRCAAVLSVAALAFVLCRAQFHGPRDEDTLAQLAAARGWAEGRGHSTQAMPPQALAWLESAGVGDIREGWIPELYQAPGYAALTGAYLRLLPGAFRERVLGTVAAPPDGFWGDYAVLVLNVVLFLSAALALRSLGESIAGQMVGKGAAWLLLASAASWTGVVGLTGIALPMLLSVALASGGWRLVHSESRGAAVLWSAILGVILGILVLVDYCWMGAFPAAVAWCAWAVRRGFRVSALAAMIGLWCLAVLPWGVRNLKLVHHPLGLAGHEVFQKPGDGRADPAEARATWSIQAPRTDWNKAGNRLLTHVKETSSREFWAVGLVAAALAVVGLAYRFRDERVGQLRLLCAGVGAGLVVAEGLLDSGEGARKAVVAVAPWISLWGAAFLSVLVASRPGWSERLGVATFALVLVQAIPLWHDLLEPRRIHFSYPPYYPVLIQTLGREVAARGDGTWKWMSDVPAGSAWYSGGPVLGRPASAEDVREIMQRWPVLCLMLTPETLDKPFFSELAPPDSLESPGRGWTWGEVHRGLVTGRMPPGFSLTRLERLAPNLLVLADPNSPSKAPLSP